MKENDIDKSLKDLYAGLRQEDCKKAPSFEQVVSNTKRRSISYAPALRIAAAAAIVISAGLYSMSMQTCKRSEVKGNQNVSWASISSWQAETDNLLSISGTHFDGSFSSDTDMLLDSQTSSKGNL
jgi:hypothetical protein